MSDRVTTCIHFVEGGSHLAHLSRLDDAHRAVAPAVARLVALCPLGDQHRPQDLRDSSLAELEKRDPGAAEQLARLPPGGLLRRRNPAAPWHRYDPGQPLGLWFWARTVAVAVPLALLGCVGGLLAGALGSPVILVAGWVRREIRRQRERLAEVVL